MVFGDLDGMQGFDTNLGNRIAWTPDNGIYLNNSNGNEFFMDNPNEDGGVGRDSWDGFNSAPNGTGLLIGQGTHFYYHFYEPKDGVPKNDFAGWGQDNGVQFNLFGNGASSNVLVPPTTEIHYHYDETSVFDKQ